MPRRGFLSPSISSVPLLQGDLFPQHSTMFPDSALQTTVEAYPMLDKARLKTELSLIYENDDFKGCSGALALFQVLMENNLQDTFTETVSLLKILITTPMSTAESERCFSTLKRIKTIRTQWDKIASTLWLCSQLRKNSHRTFQISTQGSLRDLPLRKTDEQSSCTNKSSASPSLTHPSSPHTH